jgi:hypothetical protein
VDALDKNQIEQIRKYVIESNVTILSLRDDLVDHLCCEVESRISEGKSFQEAVVEALSHYRPEDLYEVEQQTEFLLHPNKVIMKKLTYFIGLAATISMTIGLMFKIMHMPGADQLVNYGFFAFAFLFLPVVLFRKVNKASHVSIPEKLKAILGIVSAVGFLLAVITKMRMEIDLATIFLFSTTGIFCFGFLPLHFYEMYRNSLREAN